MDWISHHSSVPTSAPERRRVLILLLCLGLSFAGSAAVSVGAAVGWALTGFDLSLLGFAGVGGLFSSALSLLLVRAGRWPLAAWLQIGGVGALLGAITVEAGGLMASDAPFAWATIVLLAAVVLDLRATTVVTFAVVVAVLALALAESPSKALVERTVTLWSLSLISAALVASSSKALDDGLRLAERRGLEALAGEDRAMRALERLRRLEEFHRSVLESVHDPVVVVDEDGIVQFANVAMLHLVEESNATFLGASLIERLQTDDASTEPRHLVAAGGVRSFEARLSTAGRARVPVAVASTVLPRDGDDHVLVCCFADLRVRRAVEDELRRALELAEETTRAKSRFVASVSHELRTPLNAIIGFSELLLEESTEPTQRSDLEKVQYAARHLLALISDVLDLSKIEAGRMHVSPQTVEPERVLRELVATIGPMVDRNHNQLVLKLAEPLGVVHTDPTVLRQVVLNLLSNASKFTERGTITLSAHRAAGGLVIEVADTGPGISPRDLGQLFRPFVQVGERRAGGTGLGLVLSRRLAEELGGSLVLESQLGHGTVARLVLPTGRV